MSSEDEAIAKQVKEYLDFCHNINVENSKLAVWLSKEKQNLQGLEEADNLTEVLLFKQAIALGWDCPRAAVLLIFRKLTSDTFTVQTVGRILRMPEQKFYTNPVLNKGYVYTDISKDKIQIVAEDMDYLHTSMLQAVRRCDLKNVSLPSAYEVRLSADRNRLGPDFKKVLTKTFEDLWTVNPQLSLFSLLDFDEKAEEEQDFDSNILKNRRAAEGKGIKLDVKNINVEIPADVQFQNEVGIIDTGERAKFARSVGEINRVYIGYCRSMLGSFERAHSTDVLANYLMEVMENLFELYETEAKKVILYHINKPKFSFVIDKALKRYEKVLSERQSAARQRSFASYQWEVPEDRIYQEETHKVVTEMKEHALLPFVELNAASNPERQFATFLENHSEYIDWWYKNGDSGKQHYSIPYMNSANEKALFYVDFVVRMKNGQVFLFDTKTEGSDSEAPNKHNALIDYINQEENKELNLKGGIIVPKGSNWLYSPFKIESTSDATNWTAFYPDQYK
jgi:type III restriction enzyme